MSVKVVRAPNNPVLIGAGIALLLLAAWGVSGAPAAARALQYRIPIWVLTGGDIRDGILGIALLYVALRRSKFAAATTVVVAALLTFVFFGR